MTFQYGTRSRAVRDTLQEHLRNIFDRVLLRHDHALEQGSRSPDEQQGLYPRNTQVPGYRPDGTPNDYPHAPRYESGRPTTDLVAGRSWAVDAWPYVNGQRVAAPDVPDIIRRVLAGDAEQYVKKCCQSYMQFAYFIRVVLDTAEGYFAAHRTTTGERWRLRSGADWNMNDDITDTRFLDAPHFELVFDGLEEKS